MRNSTALVAYVFVFAPGWVFAQKAVTVPFEVLRTGHAAVKVMINGKGPFRLALDTGSPVTFVSNSCAAKIGLLTKEETGNQALFLMPRAVRDYVLIHELMHLRRMDHSRAFWRHVASACPTFGEARAWLRANGKALR